MPLGRFYKGRVMPLVVGWFGEISQEFEQTIVTLAKEAAVINTEKKGGAVHHVAAVQESNWRSNCERQRNAENVHYVRGTPQEAKEVHQANMSNNRYRPDKRN